MPDQDPEVTKGMEELALAIDPNLDIKEGVAPKQPDTSQEKPEEKPDKPEGDKPEDVKGKPADASKEEKAGDGKQDDKEGDDESPLKDIDIDKPEDVLAALLKSPEHAKALQSWSDKGVAAQVDAARQRDRPEIEASERQKAKETAEDEHFAGRSDEDVAEEIGKDKRAAAAYARYQARQEAQTKADPNSIAAAAQIFAYATQVTAFRKTVEESDLSAEDKAKLSPENFTKKPDGIADWHQAINTALIEHGAEARAQELLAKKWEAYKEERLIELDGERPPVLRGNKASAVPDLIKGDSATMLDEALDTLPKK